MKRESKAIFILDIVLRLIAFAISTAGIILYITANEVTGIAYLITGALMCLIILVIHISDGEQPATSKDKGERND